MLSFEHLELLPPSWRLTLFPEALLASLGTT